MNLPRFPWPPMALMPWCLLASMAAAQNVTGYDSMDNPYLLLLREPAVHDDLALAPKQREELRQLNERMDGPLLALRNRPAEKANQEFTELVQQTHSALEGILDESQQERLGQIMLRAGGIRRVLTPKIAERLNLSATQRKAIETILAEIGEEIQALSDELQSGASAANIQRRATLARQREQRRVLGELTDPQKRLLTQLLGRHFDPCASSNRRRLVARCESRRPRSADPSPRLT